MSRQAPALISTRRVTWTASTRVPAPPTPVPLVPLLAHPTGVCSPMAAYGSELVRIRWPPQPKCLCSPARRIERRSEQTKDPPLYRCWRGTVPLLQTTPTVSEWSTLQCQNLGSGDPLSQASLPSCYWDEINLVTPWDVMAQVFLGWVPPQLRLSSSGTAANHIHEQRAEWGGAARRDHPTPVRG